MFIRYIKLKGYYNRVCVNYKRQNRGSIYEVRDIRKDELSVTLKEEPIEYISKRGRITQKLKSYAPIDMRRTRRKPSPEL